MIAAARTAPRLPGMTGEETEALFEEFVVKFDKSYEDDDARDMRFQIFKRNLKRIDEVSSVLGWVLLAPGVGPSCTDLQHRSQGESTRFS